VRVQIEALYIFEKITVHPVKALVHGLIGAHHKIAWAVVELVPILMMDDLGATHWPPKLYFCYPTVY